MSFLTAVFHRPRTFAVLALICSCQVWAAPSRLDTDAITSGTLITRTDQGDVQALPLLSTSINTEVSGQLGKTELVQRFKNTSPNWLEAQYLFPLPTDAAVTRMRLDVGGRQIEGQIKEKAEATAIYQTAKSEGKNAALVEQHRPNLFSTAVSNIPPGGEVQVVLQYQQSVEWRAKTFSLRFPMAVTPRYTPAKVTHKMESTVNMSEGWLILPGERPEAIPLTQMDATPDNATSIHITLRPGFELASIKSLHHATEQTHLADGSYRITLKHGTTRADRDFVLEWTAAESAAPSASLFGETHGSTDYAQLSIMPPTIAEWVVPPREVIFVVDTSGSMSGQSIAAAKKALLNGIDQLSRSDTFNVIEFNSESHALFTEPQPARGLAYLRAQRFVRALEARGGTEMESALKLAMDMPGDTSRLQQVVFITDGSVGNESELLRQIHLSLGNRRLFTVGIGSAPNSYFMQESALAGRGTYTYIADLGEAEQAMTALFNKISRPALTNIHIEAQGMKEVTPSVVPDLYAGEPLQLAMKLEPGTRQITLSGRIGHALWRRTVDITRVNQESGIRVNWARQRIAQWLRQEFTGTDRGVIRDAVLDLALTHHLVSPFTSLVAVDVTPIRPADAALDRQSVPPTRPKGLDIQLAQTATGYELTALLATLILLIASTGLLLSRRLGLSTANRSSALNQRDGGGQ